jgi:Tfp pilus assembly protein PilV
MKNQRGEALIEAILALGIISLIITGIVTALISSNSNSNQSKNQNIATAYAQEGIDIARNIKETNFENFRALNGYYCVGNNNTLSSRSGSNCPKVSGQIYRREIYINRNGNDNRTGSSVERCETNNSIFVAASVSWNDTKCENNSECHKVELNSCFVDLYRLRAP